MNYRTAALQNWFVLWRWQMGGFFGFRKTSKCLKILFTTKPEFLLFLPLPLPTFGFIGFSVEMSVPSALCRLESNTFLFFLFDTLQTLACLAYKIQTKWKKMNRAYWGTKVKSNTYTLCNLNTLRLLQMSPLWSQWGHVAYCSLFVCLYSLFKALPPLHSKQFVATADPTSADANRQK